jgi:hypothetical protein
MRAVFALVLLAGSIVMPGCGGYSNNSMPPSLNRAGNVNAIVTFGDAPADGILSFEVTLIQIVLTDSSGAIVTVLSTPTRVEASHLSGTFSPLEHVSIPQGTYTSATVTFSKPEITVLDASGNPIEKEPPLTSATATVNFSPALVVVSSAVSINLDLNLAQSVVFDAAGNATVNPVIALSSTTVAGSDDKPENGEIEDIKGIIQSASGSSFIINIADGAQSLTFNTDANTKFEGITGISTLTSGLAVEVSGFTQLDGTLLATKVDVEMEQAGDAELEGLVTKVTGTPATSFQMVVHGSESISAAKPALGTTTTVNIDSNARFRVNSGKINLGSAPFSTTFDASTLSPGQEVEASTDAPNSSTSELSHTVTLHPQALTGTVSGVTASGSGITFTLTLAGDSAFTAISGQSTVSVFATSGQTINNGDKVRARGLLFGSAGGYHMAAAKLDLR